MLEKEGQMMAAVLAGGILLLGAVAAVHILRLSRKKEVSRLFDVLSSAMNDIFLMLGSDMQSVKYISPNVERLLGITTAASIRILILTYPARWRSRAGTTGWRSSPHYR